MSEKRRLIIWYIGILICFSLVALRLLYWQVLAGAKLQALAAVQHNSTVTIPADRGKILASDGFPLASNQPAYLVFAYLPDITEPVSTIAKRLTPILMPDPYQLTATPSAKLVEELEITTQASLIERLTNGSSWVPIERLITPDQKDQIEALNLKGIGFDSYEIRHYPEASMSAQLLGFVGSDGSGSPKGYFGLEGYYNLELSGKAGVVRQEKDALGRPIAIGEYSNLSGRGGRTLKTHLIRNIQLMVEDKLMKALEKYGAVAGEVLILDPKTGAVISIAASPGYDPAAHQKYPPETYAIPGLAQSYEPGSTFKSLIMAAAIDQGVINPETVCDHTCDGPVVIGSYHIRTWNDEYHPGQTMREVLIRSDNTGMIFVARQLGKDQFSRYLNDFGIGLPTGIDLEAETVPKIRADWGDIDLATGSFGQGLAVTSIQMLTAFASLANDGYRMQPQVVHQVISQDEIITIEPKVVNQPVSAETARIMTELLIESGHQIGAKRIIPKGYLIAGKSGTAQIPIAGHYDEDKTMASFVGFAPAHDPRFAMLVKLQEPTSSPWGIETAAPLWYEIAKELFVLLNIAPTP